MIHRDISPDNIMIRKDGKVRLLDLGAAKDMTTAQGVSSQIVAKKGFSPFEQYKSGGEVGPWTDVYALCATIYYCITGKLLPDAFDRIDEEEINFPDSLKEPLSEETKEALKAGLEVRVKKRTQSVEELLRQLDAEPPREEALSVNQEEGQGQNPQLISNIKQEKEIEEVPTDKISSPSKTPKVKKGVWVALAVFLVAAGVFIKVISETKGLPVMMEDANEDVEYIKNYTVLGSNLKREQICTITFQSTLENQPEDAWDVSEKQDGTVMAWVSPAENDMYELYIGGEGGIQAPKSCNQLFRYYTNVEEIRFNGCFDTSMTTSMTSMFYWCEKLEQLDLSNFNTSQVTDMNGMFRGCKNLEQLDLSNFDTSQVMDMESMFAWCRHLKQLDLSSFDMSKVTNDENMFRNCPAEVTGL